MRRRLLALVLATAAAIRCTGSPAVVSGSGATDVDARFPTPQPTHTGLSPAKTPAPEPSPRLP
ncbi:MAG: hypothetical protein M3167_02125 [Acidobacteriota bacterium]|nr:hypothetical protein [Acidobacteriota bacterium]